MQTRELDKRFSLGDDFKPYLYCVKCGAPNAILRSCRVDWSYRGLEYPAHPHQQRVHDRNELLHLNVLCSRDGCPGRKNRWRSLLWRWFRILQDKGIDLLVSDDALDVIEVREILYSKWTIRFERLRRTVKLDSPEVKDFLVDYMHLPVGFETYLSLLRELSDG